MAFRPHLTSLCALLLCTVAYAAHADERIIFINS